jgi:hypothetical protein
MKVETRRPRQSNFRSIASRRRKTGVSVSCGDVQPDPLSPDLLAIRLGSDLPWPPGTIDDNKARYVTPINPERCEAAAHQGIDRFMRRFAQIDWR